MIERSQHERLDAVARTYLDREGPSPRLVVVAGEHVESTRAAARCLQRAAGGIGIPSVLLSGASDVVDLELAHDRTPPLVIYHHGAVYEDELSRLRPPQEMGVDLLLWDLPRRERVGLRSLYLLGLWSWSLRPWQARCVLPPASEGDPELRMLRREVGAAMHALGSERPVEVLERSGSYADDSSQSLLGQVLQSLLAASSRRRANGRPEPMARPSASVRARETAAAWAMGIFACLAPIAAQASALVVEVHGLDLATPTSVAADDSRVYAGHSYFLRLQPGVGTHLEGGGIVMSTDRAQLFALLADAPLAFDDAQQSIEGMLVLHAPEFALQVRQGNVRAGPDGIVVRPHVSGPPLPGRQGLFITGVLLVMILLMVWRASSVRRKLDEPYVSVRRRKRELEG